MLKPETISWKDSNLALIGSDIDKKTKNAAAQKEDAWKGIDEKAQLKVWRIEKFLVKPWPEDKYGLFHKGDSYIVLYSYTEEGSDALEYNIHIWIGSESSQDEYGTAAYKMVEADDYLNDAAIQYREVEGNESSLFRSYFDKAIRYLAGGVESGFNHVKPTIDMPHLYRLKMTKKKKFSLDQMPLERRSLNCGDSFILTIGDDKAWLWNGEKSKPMERHRANNIAEEVCTEGTAVVLTQGQDDEADTEFWSYFPDDSGDIQPEEEDEAVKEFEPTLYRLPGDINEDPQEVGKGEPIMVEWGKSKPSLDRALLDVTDVFLLDAGWAIFVWMGQKADANEKMHAMGHADNYCRKNNRPQNIPLSMVKSDKEPKTFSGFFTS